MSPLTSRIDLLSQQLHVMKKALQDMVFDAEYVWNDDLRRVG